MTLDLSETSPTSPPGVSPPERGNRFPVDGAARGSEDARSPCGFVDLGEIGLPRVEAAMDALARMRAAEEIDDVALFLSHPKTIAVGCRDRRFACPPDLLVPPGRLQDEGIAFVRSVRGGGITYHWPGQVLCYPILRLLPLERDIGQYMLRLEETALLTLRKLGIDAYRRRDTPAHVGLWHKDHKIASMGVRVSRWVTTFGFALNVEGDISPSRFIRPCGIKDARLVTIENVIGATPGRKNVIDSVVEAFLTVFPREAVEASRTFRTRLAQAAPSDVSQEAIGWKTWPMWK